MSNPIDPKSIERGLQTAAEMVDPNVIEMMRSGVGSGAFGSALGEMALSLAFDHLWNRPGLSRRDRSLVTLGILMALRQSEELKIHTLVALRNGLSVEELEEVMYQATVYAGFPAATEAYRAMLGTLKQAGKVK